MPRVKRIAGEVGVPSRWLRGEGTIDVAALELTIVELPGVVGGGMLGRGAADKAESLAGCKSPYRQLPEVGRLAYPGRAAATKHDVPGRRSPGCPAAVFAAVGTIWGASKFGGRNITEYLQPRNATPREVVIRGQTRGADPFATWGRPMTPWKRSSRQCRESNRVQVPVPSIACIRTVSISGTCGGNKARCARM